MADLMSIDELKAEQARLGLGDVHLVHVGPTGFTIAHTDAERAAGEPLVECDLHRWLHGLSGPPVAEGAWVAFAHIPDAVQEPYGSDPWVFDAVSLYENHGYDADDSPDALDGEPDA